MSGRPLRPVEVKRLNRDWRRRTTSRLDLVLDGVTSPYNVGSIIRSAAAFGVENLWLVGRTPLPREASVGKAAMGTERFVEWHPVDDVSQAIAEERDDGLRVLALEQAEGAVPLHEADLAGDLCLVVGNEDHGLSASTLAMCDGAVVIPLPGKVGSLNVAVAAGIALAAARTDQWRGSG